MVSVIAILRQLPWTPSVGAAIRLMRSIEAAIPSEVLGLPLGSLEETP